MSVSFSYRNITGIGAEFQECNNISLRNCTFENNFNRITKKFSRFNPDFIQAEDLDKIALSGGGLNIFSGETLTALIEDCRFLYNYVILESIETFKPPLFQLDANGGAAFIRLTKLNGSSVVFRNTVFDTNSAQIDGGAVYLTISSGASNNSIVFDGCIFRNNSVAETSGGAISVVLYNSTLQNKILVQDCVFEDNSAVGGGAIGVVVYDIGNSQLSPEFVSIKNSVFKKNRAIKEGSAVGIFSFLRGESTPFEIQFQNW